MNSFEWQSYEKKILNPDQCGFNRIFSFLRRVDGSFSTKLSLRVDLQEYAKKLASKAFNLFVNHDGDDIAHAAFYCDEGSFKVFITSIAVMDEYAGKGLGKKILNEIENFACSKKIQIIELESDSTSEGLLNFYLNSGFKRPKEMNDSVLKKNIEITCQYKNYITAYNKIINQGIALKLATYKAFVNEAERDQESTIKAFPLLPVLVESLHVDTVLTVAKLIENQRGDRTFQKFVNFCENNQKRIAQEYSGFNQGLIDKTNSRLDSIKDNIQRIMAQKDQYFVYADKKYFFEPEVILRDFPETYNDLVEIVQALQFIVSAHSQVAFGHTPISIDGFAYVHADKIVKFLEEGAKAWHKGYRPDEE